MKRVSNIFLTILVVITSNIYSMDYFQHLPDELHVPIIIALAESGSVNENIQTLRALTLTNKRFHRLANDSRITKKFLTTLNFRFPEKDTKELALDLQTKGSHAFIDNIANDNKSMNSPLLIHYKNTDNDLVLSKMIKIFCDRHNCKVLIAFPDIAGSDIEISSLLSWQIYKQTLPTNKK